MSWRGLRPPSGNPARPNRPGGNAPHHGYRPGDNTAPHGNAPPRGANPGRRGGRGGYNVNIPRDTLDKRSHFDSPTTRKIFEGERLKAIDDAKDLEVHPLRPSFVQTQTHVLTNHFAVYLPKKPLYQYQIEGMGTNDKNGTVVSPPRGKQELIFQKLVEACDVLRLNKMGYATDHMKLFVSWDGLRPLFNRGDANPGDSVFETKIVLRGQVGDIPEDARDLKVIYSGEIPIQDMVDVCNGTKANLALKAPEYSTTIPVDHAINLIIRKASLASSRHLFGFRSNRIYLQRSMVQLSPGVTAHNGLFSTLKSGMGHPLLIVNAVTSAFREPFYVDSFLEVMNENYDKLLDVKVEVTYSGRIRTIAGWGGPPSRQMFNQNNDPAQAPQNTSVLDYLCTKNIDEALLDRIALSRFKCAKVKSGDRIEWFAAEALRIVNPQLVRKLSPEATEEMIKRASRSPRDNVGLLENEALRYLGVKSQQEQGSILRAAGIQVGMTLVKVPAREIAPPKIHYGTNSVETSKWNLSKRVFYDTGKTFSGRITVLVPRNLNGDGGQCARNLIGQMHSLGIRFALGIQNTANLWRARDVDIEQSSDRTTRDTIFKSALEWAEKQQTGMVVFINHSKIQAHADAFNTFKRQAEQKFGIHSFCISSTNRRQFLDNANVGFLSNLAMKVNIKIGNTNHSLHPVRIQGSEAKGEFIGAPLFNNSGEIDTIILGADDSKEGARSLAALVGSVDGKFGQFYGSMRHQAKDKEIIDGIDKMVVQRLRAFHTKSKRVPNKVLYYRDGLDEGQYDKVQRHEILKLKKGYRTFLEEKGLPPKDPLVTAVVVTKRTRTRFYPETVPEDPKADDNKGNCKPGTCIDSGVTHPNYFDFYLQSHRALSENTTTKPTYYFVLENGMKFSPRCLQDFTNALCSTYVRACLPVGYAPPAYYADRLCDRVGAYFADLYSPDRNKQETDGDIQERKRRENLTEAQRDAEDLQTWMDRYNPEGGNDHGPWHKKLNDTMFWM